MLDFQTFKTFNSEQAQFLIKKFAIQSAIISSVKTQTQALEATLSKELSFFTKLTHETSIPIVNDYGTPQTLGKDRLAAVIGAYDLFPNEHLLVIDAGTCITYDLLTQNAHYKGGGIAPGIWMRFKALHHFTDQLPNLYTLELGNLIGKNTRQSILSGVLWGMISEVNGIILLYEQKYVPLKVLFTGGDAPFFESKLKKQIFVFPNLVLTGLNKILTYNVSKAL